VNGRARQEIILAGGAEPTEYRRLLGRLRPASRSLRLRLDPDLSSPAAREVTVSAVHTGCVPDADPEGLVWRHAPILHYRALDSRLDSLCKSGGGWDTHGHNFNCLKDHLLPEFDRFALFNWNDALSVVGRNLARVLTDVRPLMPE